MARDTTRSSKATSSTESTTSCPFFSARSSIEDNDLQNEAGNHLVTSPALTSVTLVSSHQSVHTEDSSRLPSSSSHEAIGQVHASSSRNSISLAPTDIKCVTREESTTRNWIPAPQIPLSVVKYTIGRREVAMQSQSYQPFDLVQVDPYVHSPLHTPQTEKLKAWHKLVIRSPQCLPSRHNDPEWPQIKLAFGPLGWDQHWGYELVDLRRVMHNAGYRDWWLRRSENHFIWCNMHHYVDFYGAEVRYPYGHDVRMSPCNEEASERIVRIPAKERVLVSLGGDLLEWARQILFEYNHWQDGPPFMSSFFDPESRREEPPTIVLRFRNTHPERCSIATMFENKGGWTKGWLSTDEVAILSGATDTTYLDTILAGGPKSNAEQTDAANRMRTIHFWDLESKRRDMIEWLASKKWIRERFEPDSERALWAFIQENISSSVARAIRAIPPGR